jgi:phosphatidylglycerophosphatase C
MQRLGPRVRNVLNYLAVSGQKGPATFDGDGTLWDGDVGEGFFQWMLKNNHYPAHRAPVLKWAWKGYKQGTYNGERFYELMVTSLAGMPEAKVKRLAEQYFETHHRQQIYRPMSNLIEALQGLEIEPWVVSGSPKWVVAAGAKHMGIPEEKVIGLSVKVDDRGNLTDQVVRPVPWKAGKALRILQDVGKTPVLAAGNSHGDIQMLRIASEMPLVVNPGPQVREQATFNGWTVHDYTRRDTWAHPPADIHPPSGQVDIAAPDRYPPVR